MEIVHYPHPALRWKSKPITRIDGKLKSTIAEMFELMYASRGIGLAANQVALPLRVFVVNPTGDAAEPDQEVVFINPEIVSRSGSEEAEEGCLSLPELYGQVRRPDKIVVEAYGLNGEPFAMELDDLPARLVQHETDHLDGVMFIDRMSESGRRELEPLIADFEMMFHRHQAVGNIPSDAEIAAQLKRLEPPE